METYSFKNKLKESELKSINIIHNLLKGFKDYENIEDVLIEIKISYYYYQSFETNKTLIYPNFQVNLVKENLINPNLNAILGSFLKKCKKAFSRNEQKSMGYKVLKLKAFDNFVYSDGIMMLDIVDVYKLTSQVIKIKKELKKDESYLQKTNIKIKGGLASCDALI